MLIPLQVFAVPDDKDVEKAKNNKPTLEERLIRGNVLVSQWFDGMVEGIDLFLVGKKVTNEKNESAIRLDNSSYSMEGENFKNETGIAVIPRLNNLEKYWQLKFTSYDERQERRGVTNSYLRQSPRERNYGATIGLFRKLGDIRTAFQPRIELQDPLKVSHSLIFESIAEMKTYEINPKVEFFASPTKGTGIFHALNFHFTLTKIYSLTLINEAEYDDKPHLYSTTNGFSVGHLISERSSFAYSWLFLGNNRDNYHLDGYSLAVTWSHVLYRKILDYSVVPHWDFFREREFRGQAGLTFNVSLNF